MGKQGLSDDWRDDLPFQRLAVKCTGTHCDSLSVCFERLFHFSFREYCAEHPANPQTQGDDGDRMEKAPEANDQ